MKQITLRTEIGRRVRELRLARGLTQRRLGRALGLSQNRLSEVERGQGSFTAEQLVSILGIFNLTLEELLPGDPAGQLQNALARLGAAHLSESEDVIPSERLRGALAVIRETLASADSPRQISGLAPVLVRHSGSLNLAKLQRDLDEIGLGQRFDWVAESTLAALKVEASAGLPPEWAESYARARTRLGAFLGKRRALPGGEDILDSGIASAKTLSEVRDASSAIARRWGIVTRLQPADFLEALRAARGAH